MIFKDKPDKNVTKRNSFIRLSLRKPKEWKVALTTSVSSPAIIPPDIQLWDEERGDVLLDTSQPSCVKSKSASFTRTGGSSSGSIRNHRKSTKFECDHNYKFDVSQSYANGSYRSKSLSTRKEEGLVKPDEYERPPTPVMVARRISLAKDSSAQSLAKGTQVNGIVTHHRKQNSDSSLGSSGRMKVRHNVSFGRVDTIDDSSSISSFSLNKPKEKLKEQSLQSSRCGSSPRIVITEVTGIDDLQKVEKSRSRSENSKHRSRSGIPILVSNRDPPSNIGAGKNGPVEKERKSQHNHVNHTGRKSRMDLYMSQQIGRHKFTVTRVPEDEKSHLPQTPVQKTSHHCDRGNCPFEKYLNGVTPEENVAPRNVKQRIPSVSSRKHVLNGSVSSKDTPKRTDRDVRESSTKREGSRHRKKRVASRSRQQMMTTESSSSDSEEWRTPRTPPRRKRWSRTPKGDRLVGVNGSVVRSPREAEEKLRHSPDIVHLQLRRPDGNRSLPRRRLEEMGSNVSRHSGKGLTGRRSQSSGNLCNGKSHGVSKFFSPCGGDVAPRDRYKFCGSLPNHLDSNEEAEYRNNNNVKENVVLRLQPLVPKGEALPLDQGYGSERSPEDEIPPDLPPPTTVNQLTCPVHHPAAKPVYPFLHKNSTFTVTLLKTTRGLGLSVTGGVDTEEPWPGLIRIKRLFPHQPAWQSGQLAQGDFLLVVNNTSLVGLTNYEALEVLRTTPAEVVLTVCRPPPELQVLNAPTPADNALAPPPPRRDNAPSTSSSSLQLPLKRMESFGEFELTLKKVNGSLGFTLRKEDESILGHYVRALVREPALSDGRIKPGDKIVAVNGVDMSPMSHEEAVTFLRQCGQEVHLRLYRDAVQTPVQALSPTEHHRTIKPILRKEAQDMLSDLAVKKSMSPNESSGSSTLSREGRTSSPRKRRLTKTPSPDLRGERLDNHLSWSDEVLERISPSSDSDKPRRPDTLNFGAERKPHFQFSAVSKTEENLASLDSLDGSSIGDLGVGPLPSEPVSMPPLLTSTSDTTIGFSYRNPAYRSANPAPSKSKSSLSEDLPENRCSDNDLTTSAGGEEGGDGSKGLLKWKGVVFTPDDGTETATATSPDDSISQITEVDGKENQVLVVELNRGWNSRLGFSLQQSGRDTLISAIHPDSVASRDGRLKVGDQLIMVNDESIEGMSTAEVIDLLRKIRGSICITVWRKPS